MKFKNALVIWAVFSTLTACSPYLYKDEVTNVSSAVNSIGSGWKNSQQAMGADYQGIVVERASWNGLSARLSGPCVVAADVLKPARTNDKLVSAFKREISRSNLNRGEPPCNLDLIQNDVMRPAPLTDDATMKKIDETMSALSAYAAALLAVTNATDKDDLTKAATGFNTAIGQMADAAAKLGANAAEVAGAKAASSLSTDIIAAILDTERYRILKDRVISVDPIMPTLAGEVSDALDLVRRKRLPILAQRVSLEVVEYNVGSAQRSSNDNQALLAAIQTQVSNYNDLDSAKTADVATKLAKTHHDLADALKSNKGQLTALVDGAKALANDAEQLNKALASSGTTSAQTASGKASK